MNKEVNATSNILDFIVSSLTLYSTFKLSKNIYALIYATGGFSIVYSTFWLLILIG